MPALTGEKDSCFDLVTGEAHKDVKVRVDSSNGCGTFTGSIKYFVGQIGGPIYEFDTHKTLHAVNLKSLCDLGEFISQGQLFSPPTACFCSFCAASRRWSRPATLTTGGAPNVAEQLVTGAGDIRSGPAGHRCTRLDHPPRRRGPHGLRRGRCADDGAAGPLDLRPTAPFRLPARIPFTEETEHKLTEAVTAGGLVFFGASDGRVQCLSAADGAPQWTYWTEGGVFAAPTVAQGRLYVGSADGRVYAFEATTGRLLWRFRPGPSDRRVLVYGHLQSPWPVNSGVLVADGVAYAAAGMTLQPGSYVVALDAVTGTPRWQQMNPAAANDVGAKAPRASCRAAT